MDNWEAVVTVVTAPRLLQLSVLFAVITITMLLLAELGLLLLGHKPTKLFLRPLMTCRSMELTIVLFSVSNQGYVFTVWFGFSV